MQRWILFLFLIGLGPPAFAQGAHPVCKDTTLSATGREEIVVPGGVEVFAGAHFTYYTTGSPATLSITIEAGNVDPGTATPTTKIAAETNTTAADMGWSSGPYRHWYANLATLTGGTNPTVVLTACFYPGSVSTGGAPGGANGTLQYNDSGSLGGIAGFTTDGTSITGVGPQGALSGLFNLQSNADTNSTYMMFLRPKLEDGRTTIFFARSPAGGTNPAQAIGSMEVHGAYTNDSGTVFTDKGVTLYTADSTGGLVPRMRWEALQANARVLIGEDSPTEIIDYLRLYTDDGLFLRKRTDGTGNQQSFVAPNAGAFKYRNFLDSADLNALSFDNSNNLYFGNTGLIYTSATDAFWKVGPSSGLGGAAAPFLAISHNFLYTKDYAGGAGGGFGMFGGLEDDTLGAGKIFYGMGAWSEYTGTGNAATKEHIGLAAQCTMSGSGNLNNCYGADAEGVMLAGAGGAGVLAGYYARVQNQSASTAVISAAHYIDTPVNSGGGSLGSNYGIYMADQVGDAIHTNAGPVYLGDTTNAYRYKSTIGTALVAGDFALSAGWGDAASIGTITGTDQRFRATVTSAGAGQADLPTVTLTFTDGTWTTAPFFSCSRAGGDLPLVAFDVTTVAATTLLLTFLDTPIAAQTYTLECVGIG